MMDDTAYTGEIELESHRRGRTSKNISRIKQNRNVGLIRHGWRGASWPGKAGEDATERGSWWVEAGGGVVTQFGEGRVPEQSPLK